MKPYLLLTPGPLTTSETVKEAMMTDWCTWDADYNVHIVEEIRKSLVALATTATDEYTSVLLQGSGTYCVEAVIGSVITPKHKLLILSNGAYGDRMGHIAEYHGINYDMLAFEETEQVSVDYVDDYLSNNSDITHVAVVHCETTTGILNPLKEIAHIVKLHNKKLIVDAMSSFGGVPLDMYELGIDFMISSANKCIQGVPGFGFIIARKSELLHCKGVSRSLSLAIYDDGKRTWQMEIYFAHPCSKSLQAGTCRTGRRRGSSRPPQEILRKPPHIGRRNARTRLQNLAAGRIPVAHHHLFPLSESRFRFQLFLHPTERKRFRHLSGQDIPGRYFPHRQHRRCTS